MEREKEIAERQIGGKERNEKRLVNTVPSVEIVFVKTKRHAVII